MFENIAKFFRKLIKTEAKDTPSKDTAKERLHLVLMQDRANVSADFLELMKQEIIEVIKKYIEVEESAIDVRLTNEIGEDGTKGAPSLYANIPILNIKNNIKTENTNKEAEKTDEKKEQIKEEKQEDNNKDRKEEVEKVEKVEKVENKDTKGTEENKEKKEEVKNDDKQEGDTASNSDTQKKQEDKEDKSVEDKKNNNSKNSKKNK